MDWLRRWWRLGAVTAGVVIAAWLLYVLWTAKAQPGLAAYWTVPVASLPLATAVITWALRGGTQLKPSDPERLDYLADRLASEVRSDWRKAAEGRGLTGLDPIPVSWDRPSETVAGLPARSPFPPLPGLKLAEDAELASGRAENLHDLYGGLGSGRLIVTGPPGSGKSGAAVLLVLAALRHRESVPGEDRQKVPVPVLLTAQDWEPDTEPVADWLVRKLRGTYPMFGGAAGERATRDLLAAGRIAVILDGLDEIAGELQPVALEALSRQAMFRLVVLSRTKEMADAASRRGVLHGAAAVELKPVSADDASDYLERAYPAPPPEWQELTRRIRAEPDGPLARALGSPLALTLIRDTYHVVKGAGQRREGEGEESVGELLEFWDGLDPAATEKAEAVTDHLLDRVLAAAYTRHPGEPPLLYGLETARHALTRIAARMNSDGTRDLNWWRLPEWVPRTPHAVVSVVAGAIATGLAAGLVYGVMAGAAAPLVLGFITGGPVARFAFGLAFGAVYGIGIGIAGGLAAGAASRAAPASAGGGEAQAGRGHWPKWSYVREILPIGLRAGLWAGLSSGLLLGLAASLLYGPVLGIRIALGDCLAYGVGTAGLTAWLVDRARSPRRDGELPQVGGNLRLVQALNWQNLAAGLAVGLVVGLAGGLAVTLEVGVVAGVGYGLAATFLLGLRSSLTPRPGSSASRPDMIRSLDPVTSWRRNRNRGLSLGLAVGLMVAVASGLGNALAIDAVAGTIVGIGHVNGAAAGVVVGIVNGVGAGVGVGLLNIRGFPVWVATIWLAVTWRTPWRLMHFLEDAHRRHVLRTVGPAYQFRHARLQDRLAAAAEKE